MASLDSSVDAFVLKGDNSFSPGVKGQVGVEVFEQSKQILLIALYLLYFQWENGVE